MHGNIGSVDSLALVDLLIGALRRPVAAREGQGVLPRLQPVRVSAAERPLHLIAGESLLFRQSNLNPQDKNNGASHCMRIQCCTHLLLYTCGFLLPRLVCV